ncbi:hypothetical protein Fcan01_04843 [Folsomia candida]|uniref:Uncharacterized protein n=1 Tax=Folsomia candida TaxID=158441 RepID=A0A226ERM3_FOLCA|nr:hypothetical protein Fcan01_04843 [Folsomia candida]
MDIKISFFATFLALIWTCHAQNYRNVSKLGTWIPLPTPVVGTPVAAPATGCQTCTEAACCSNLCPNSYFCSVTAGAAPQCFQPPGSFTGVMACKRPNCDTCTATQISCAAVTTVCAPTAVAGVCDYNY